MQKPTATLLTILSIFSRLVPHPANFTTIGATSLFAGGKVSQPWSYILPITAMLVTDLFLGFHSTMLYVYGSITLAIFIGQKFLANNPSYSRLATAALANSAVFFLVTNFGVWQAGHLYPHTISGLMESYLMGLPFWKNMLVGDLIFTVGFYKIYQLAEEKSVIRQLDKRIIGYTTGR